MRHNRMVLAVTLVGCTFAAGQTPPETPTEPAPATSVPAEIVEPPAVVVEPAKAHADPCRIPGSVRGSEEYMLWWIKSGSLPPLATRASGAPPILGQPGVRETFGGSINLNERSGGRFAFGQPLNESRTTGLEAAYWFLGSRTSSLMAAGTWDEFGPIVGRPFIDATSGRESFVTTAAPDFQAGEFRASWTTRAQGFEANVVTDLFAGANWQIDALAGYRLVHFHEGLNLTQVGAVNGPMGDRRVTWFNRADDFDCDNQYHGGQIGLRGDIRRGPLFAEATGKIAFGQVNQVVRVSGVTGVTLPGQPQIIQPGGLLALASNSGRLTRESFAVLPEAIARAGWAWGEHARFFVGYNFMYLSDVVRPGDQIDRTINVSQAPYQTGIRQPGGPERPALMANRSEVWLQGLLIGFEGKW